MIPLLHLRGALIISFILVILASMHMRDDTTCIYTHAMGGYHESTGILGVELSRDSKEWSDFFNASCARSLKANETIQCHRAHFLERQILRDYLFIPAYGLLFVLLSLIVFHKQKMMLVVSLMMIGLLLLCDLIENHFLLHIIQPWKDCVVSAHIIPANDLMNASSVSMVKWVTIMLFILLLFHERFKHGKFTKALSGLTLVLIMIFIWQVHPQLSWDINFSEMALIWMLGLLVGVFVSALFGRLKWNHSHV